MHILFVTLVLSLLAVVLHRRVLPALKLDPAAKVKIAAVHSLATLATTGAVAYSLVMMAIAASAFAPGLLPASLLDWGAARAIGTAKFLESLGLGIGLTGVAIGAVVIFLAWLRRKRAVRWSSDPATGADGRTFPWITGRTGRAYLRARYARRGLELAGIALVFISVLSLESAALTGAARVSFLRLQVHMAVRDAASGDHLPRLDMEEDVDYVADLPGSDFSEQEALDRAAENLTNDFVNLVALRLSRLSPDVLRGVEWPSDDGPRGGGPSRGGPEPSGRGPSGDGPQDDRLRKDLEDRFRSELERRLAEQPETRDTIRRLAQHKVEPVRIAGDFAEDVAGMAVSRSGVREVITSLIGEGLFAHLVDTLVGDVLQEEMRRLAEHKIGQGMRQKENQLAETPGRISPPARPTGSATPPESSVEGSQTLRSKLQPPTGTGSGSLSPAQRTTRVVEVYGARGRCPRTVQLMNYLDGQNIRYRYHDVDANPLARLEGTRIAPGARLLPILVVDGKYVNLSGTPGANTAALNHALGTD